MVNTIKLCLCSYDPLKYTSFPHRIRIFLSVTSSDTCLFDHSGHGRDIIHINIQTFVGVERRIRDGSIITKTFKYSLELNMAVSNVMQMATNICTLLVFP